MKKVIVGMSGGVDSSVAASILKDEGYEVIGITFKFIDDFDATDAKKVCEKLGIEHHIVDQRDKFKNLIIDSFINDYKNGLTPNPCVLCNRDVKLKFLFDLMDEYDCDYMATGHYAKIIDGNLYKSVDLNKDQTYFLCQVPKERLNKLLLPLEGIEKTKVREIAAKIGLEVADKKDSTDVCFINSKFKEYLSQYVESNKGDIIDISNNKKMGTHNGLSFYTIGQRRGLNIGGTQDRAFVVGKDLNKNILYICTGDDNDYLISDSCLVENFNYLKEEKVTNCKAKFRYRQEEVPVEIEWLDNNKVIIHYNEGMKRVTPGQACVLYIDDECLGGGIIKEVRKNKEKLWYI